MQLRNLGFDSWFEQRVEDLQTGGYHVARITAVDRDRYLVRNTKTEIQAELTGKLRFSADSSLDLPCVGDWALVQYYDDDSFAIIHDLLPRKSVLRRKSSGKTVEYQLIAANIDVAFVVQSCDRDFNLRRLDRYLVMINDCNIEPVLVLSKTDLIDTSVLEQKIADVREAGFSGRLVGLSNMTSDGLNDIHNMLEPGLTYCLLGSSGVGKTTLLNILIGKEVFETAAIREKDHRGRHTTTRRHLIVLESGAMMIDNPGMRELGFIKADTGFEETFPEIKELSEQCRFRDCTHSHEAGCAVLEAVESGRLSEARYQSYLKLTRESEYFERSYVEKRKRDKDFGKMVKSIMKHKKDRR